MSELMCSECKKCDGDRCTYFDNDMDRESTIACILFEPKKPTLFDRITASPEVLAEKLVFGDSDGVYWHSTIVFCKMFPDCFEDFYTEAEAIAATVAKLKEVCND